MPSRFSRGEKPSSRCANSRAYNTSARRGLAQRLPCDHIHRTGLVFQRDKEGAPGGLRLLMQRDNAAGGHLLPVGQGNEFLRAEQAPGAPGGAAAVSVDGRRSVTPADWQSILNIAS